MIRPEEIKPQVREHYARRAAGGGCCGGATIADACCGDAAETQELEGVFGPSLGCGSPLEHARVQAGETVVDLGSGAGRETILAAKQAGSAGRAFGVDMTPEMIQKARENAARNGAGNVEFVLGDIEGMPLPDGTADVVISNCVINLLPDKAAAFREAYRILKPGGRLVVADMVSNGPLPQVIREMAGAWAGCVAGAADISAYLQLIRDAGFVEVDTVASTSVPRSVVFSATVTARRPAA